VARGTVEKETRNSLSSNLKRPVENIREEKAVSMEGQKKKKKGGDFKGEREKEGISHAIGKPRGFLG